MTRWMLVLCSAGALAAQAADPRLAISLNESSAAVIFPGWPVLAQVSIINDVGGGDLRLVSASSAWPLAIRFAVTGPSGSLEDWKFQLSTDPREPMHSTES